MKKYVKSIVHLILLILFCCGLFSSCERNSNGEQQNKKETKHTQDGNSLLKIEEKNDSKDSNEGIATEDSPLVLLFDENKNNVGKCTVELNEIELVKRGSNEVYVRITATIRNNSADETYITARKPGSFHIGKFYSSSDELFIGWNDKYKWTIDKNIKSDYGWTLAAKEEKVIYTTGAFLCSDEISNKETPRLDLYFSNNDDWLTIPING